MSRWRSLVVLVLLLLPILAYMAVGTWALWKYGWYTWLWVPWPVCWGLAFFLLRWWKKYFAPPDVSSEIPMHWTPRDQAAWKLVLERSKSLGQIPPDDLTRIQFYVDTATQLSLEIAHVYHPKAKDPVSQLTIPEILAALELVFEDLAELVDDYVPASHLMTVNHYRHLAKIPKWSNTLSKFYWPISAILAPQTVVARYAASHFVVNPVTRDIQSNVLAWFTIMFIERVGYYAIELNSGRLAGGADRFRETLKKMEARERRAGGVSPPVTETAPKPDEKTNPPDNGQQAPDEEQRTEVTIALVGQTKAGKSSLINAILGDQQAKTDILPATSEVARYRLDWEEADDHLTLLDTVGYAADGATIKQLEETKQALRDADLVLFVMNANSPAREPDREMLETLRAWFEVRKELKPVPVLGVLTHIDLLSPVMEWSPPYDWQSGSRPKEVNIREAVRYNAEQFASALVGVVPVCADVARNREFGVDESLLPAMTPLLDNARACSLLRTLHKELKAHRVERLAKQFWKAGKSLIQANLPTLEEWLTRPRR